MRNIFRDGLIVLGAFLVSVLCGTSNALNILSQAVRADMNMTEVQYTIFATLAIIGGFFTIPAGWLLDRSGPFVTVALGVTLQIVCMFLSSFVPKSTLGIALLSLAWLLVGFGGGAAFLAALGLTIKLSPSGSGIPVAASSAGMSLSVLVVVTITQQYESIASCTLDSCWRDEVRVWAITAVILQVIGALLLLLFKDENYPHLAEITVEEVDPDPEVIQQVNDLHGFTSGNRRYDRNIPTFEESMQSIDEESSSVGIEQSEKSPLLAKGLGVTRAATLLATRANSRRLGFKKSLKILKHPYFWVLFCSYAVGVGTCMFVLTGARQIFSQYDKKNTLKAWEPRLLNIWSILNATCNVIVSLGVSYAQQKNRLKKPVYLVAAFQAFFAFDFAAMAFLMFSDYPANAAFAFLLSGVGISFGAYNVLLPTIVAQDFGAVNFGKYFAYMSVAAATASQVFPNVATLVDKYVTDGQGYAWFMICGCAVLLLLSSVALIVSPKTQFVGG